VRLQLAANGARSKPTVNGRSSRSITDSLRKKNAIRGKNAIERLWKDSAAFRSSNEEIPSEALVLSQGTISFAA
jgi:hypothetical protein